MKLKKLLLLPLVSLALVSCNETSTSEVSSQASSYLDSSSQDSTSIEGSSEATTIYDLDEVLTQYKRGYKLEFNYTQEVNGVTTTYRSVTEVEDDKMTFKLYNGDSSTPSINETFVKGEKGQVQATRLNVSNTHTYYDLYNIATSEVFDFEADGYSNFFKNLDAFCFDSDGNVHSLHLNEASLNSVYTAISTQLYGNPGLNVTSFDFTVEDMEKAKIDVSFSFEGSATYTYEGSASIRPLGENETIDLAYPLYEEVEDASFDEAIKSLKNTNYTLTIENYSNDTLVSTSSYKTTNDAVYYKTPDEEGTTFYEMAYAYGSDGLIYEAQKTGDKFLLTSLEGEEGSLDMLRPNLNIARECFDYDETTKVYKLKDRVEGDAYDLTILSTLVDTFQDLTVSITEDSVVFTNKNTRGNASSIFTFSNIGTTTQDFTYADFETPSEGTLFKDILSQTDTTNLANFLSQEDIDSLPAPDIMSLPNWVDFSEEAEVMMMLVYADDSVSFTDADIKAYGDKIEAMGYTSTEGLNGGIAYTKANNSNPDSPVTSYIEILNYEGFFTIVISTAEIMAEM